MYNNQSIFLRRVRMVSADATSPIDCICTSPLPGLVLFLFFFVLDNIGTNTVVPQAKKINIFKFFEGKFLGRHYLEPENISKTENKPVFTSNTQIKFTFKINVDYGFESHQKY